MRKPRPRHTVKIIRNGQPAVEVKPTRPATVREQAVNELAQDAKMAEVLQRYAPKMPATLDEVLSPETRRELNELPANFQRALRGIYAATVAGQALV